MRVIYVVLLVLLTLRIVWYWYDREEMPETSVFLSGIVNSEPKVQQGVIRFNLEKYQVIYRGPIEVHFGDVVEIKGKVGNRSTIYYPELKIKEISQFHSWWSLIGDIRSKIFETYQIVLPKADADLLAGIALGSVGMDRQFKSQLANVGLSHVVAASGMNVTLVSGFVFWFLNQIVANRWVKIGVGSIMILFYATLTGFDPPIVRAVLMAIGVLISGIVGRKVDGFWGLAMAAFIMLWASPDLIISPSFLLSFSSMTGQVFLSSLSLDVPKLASLITAIFLQSLVAILFTFPIVVIFFATFSPISLFTNVLVLWTVEPLMILSGLMATLGLVFTDFARACALPARGLLEYFLWVVNSLSQSNWNIWPVRLSDPLSCLFFATGYYLVLLAGILGFNESRFANKNS